MERNLFALNLKSAPFKIALALVAVLILVASLKESPLNEAYDVLPRPLEWTLLFAIVLFSLGIVFFSSRGHRSNRKLLSSPIFADWILWFTVAGLGAVVVTYIQGILGIMSIQEAARSGVICLCNPSGFPMIWIIPLNPMYTSNELAIADGFPLLRISFWLALSVATTVLLFGGIPLAIRKRLSK